MSKTKKQDKVKPAEWHPHSSLECLPFDQYQRYRITEQIVNALRWKERLTIVDVGGHPGHVDRFLPDDDTYVLDQRHCHARRFALGDACSLPYKDNAFDIAINIDILEHIAPEQRHAFIEEQLRVCKKYVILGAPFASEAVSQAERIVYEYIGAKYGFEYDFLAEHLASGLPDLKEVCRILDDQRVRYVTLPNGYLYNWLFMLLVHFSIEWTESTPALSAAIHEFYNTNFYQADNRAPSYRTLLVISKSSDKKLNTLPKKIIRPPEQVDGDARKLELANVLLNVLELQKVRQGDRKIAELRTLVEQHKDRVRSLEIEKRDVQQVREEAEKTVGEMKQELQRAGEEKQNLARRLEEQIRDAQSSAQNLIQELKETREQGERERHQLQDKIRDAEKIAANLHEETDSLKDKLTSVSHECDLLEQKITSLDNDLQRTLNEKTAVEGDRAKESLRFTEETERMKQAQAALRSELEDLHRAKEHYRNRVEILYEELRRKKKYRFWSKR